MFGQEMIYGELMYLRTDPFEKTGILFLDPDYPSNFLIDGIHIYIAKVGGNFAEEANKYIGKKVIVKGYVEQFEGGKTNWMAESIQLAEEIMFSKEAGFSTFAIILLVGATLFMFKGKKK